MRNSTASLFLSRRQKFLLSVCILIIFKQSGRGREISVFYVKCMKIFMLGAKLYYSYKLKTHC